MMKHLTKICVMLTLLLSAATPAFSQNKFYYEQTDIEQNTSGTLKFMLDNPTTFYGFQADITFPEGLQIEKNNEGKLDISLSVRTDDTYQLTSNLDDKKVLHIAVYSSSNPHHPIKGNSGELFTIKVKATYEFHAAPLEITNLIFVDENDKDYKNISTEKPIIGLLPTSISILPSKIDLFTYGYTTATTTVIFNPTYTTVKELTWSSVDVEGTDVARVDESGMITAQSNGDATITAVTPNGKISTCEVNVSTPTEGLHIFPENITMEKGSSEAIEAFLFPSNASDDLDWKSSDPNSVSVERKPDESKKAIITALNVTEGTPVTITAKSGGFEATCSVEVVISATDVEIEPYPVPDLYVGKTLTLNATIYPPDATDQELTWNIDDPSKVKIIETSDDTHSITLEALDLGDVIIKATGKTLTGDINEFVTVNVVPTPAESITIDQETIELKRGENKTLTATVHPAKTTDKSVTWTSSDESVATVSEFGEVTAVNKGQAIITATTHNGKSAACIVTVVNPVESITLNKGEIVLKKGEKETLIATVLPEDASDTSVTWTSSDESVATVKEGLVTALTFGISTITVKANDGSGVEATCTVSVVPTPVAEIILSDGTKDLHVGEEFNLTATVLPTDATNKSLEWSSDNEETVTVDQNGKITGKALGEATITVKASDGSGITATCKVTVVHTPATSITLKPSSVEMKVGGEIKIEPSFEPADATYQTVTWTSSAPTIATVDESGKITALALGDATITATSETDQVYGTCAVTVVPTPVESFSISPTSKELKAEETFTITTTITPTDATDKTVIWSSDYPETATVDSEGNVTAKVEGKATITAKCGDFTETCSVTVIPTPAQSITLSQDAATLKVREKVTVYATVLPPTTTDKTVTWTSANENIATVDPTTGEITGIAIGETVVTATCGNVSATCRVNVVRTPMQSITLSNTSLSMIVGDKTDLTATINPSDATDPTLNWTSSDESVVTVTGSGTSVIVEAMGAGNAVITVSSPDGVSATCDVTVTIIPVVDLTIDKTELTLTEGDTETITATVTPDNASYKTVTWESSDIAIATVSQEGVVTAIKAGTATIYASSSNSIRKECYVTVNPLIIEATDVTILNPGATLHVGESIKLQPTVTPANTTDPSLTWKSSREDIATVDADGNVTAIAIGETTVTASCGKASGTCTVTVISTPINAINLSNYTLTLDEGDKAEVYAIIDPVTAPTRH